MHLSAGASDSGEMENGEPGPPKPIERMICAVEKGETIQLEIIDVEKKLGVVFGASSFALFCFLLDALTAKQVMW